MSLLYIIDGYNVIKHRLFPAPVKNKDARLALLDFIRSERLCGSGKNKIILVFDGYPDLAVLRQQGVNTEIVFSQEKSADEAIKKMVESSSCPRNIEVVTDDREIKFCVSHFGARVVKIEEFFGRSKRKPILDAETSVKSDLSYTQIHKINKELKDLWLKQ